MKPQEIEKLKQLDPQGLSGTLASILLDPNINQASYLDVLYYLLSKVMEERGYYERTTNKMSTVLLANKLVRELNECLELGEK